jgi:hypothetical protein
VEEYVGIAVTDKLPVVRHIDAAQPQWSAGGSAVGVFADANSEVARSGYS